jgi:hypothetical protein
MNGLRLVAAGLCGRALTLGLTALAQAPKRAPVVECPAPAALQSIESDVPKWPADSISWRRSRSTRHRPERNPRFDPQRQRRSAHDRKQPPDDFVEAGAIT